MNILLIKVADECQKSIEFTSLYPSGMHFELTSEYRMVSA
jgi:hypothetical protein